MSDGKKKCIGGIMKGGGIKWAGSGLFFFRDRFFFGIVDATHTDTQHTSTQTHTYINCTRPETHSGHGLIRLVISLLYVATTC